MASAQRLESKVKEAAALLGKVQAWGAKFPSVLARARKNGLQAGWVWQDDLIEYFSEWEILSSDLRLMEKSLGALSFDDQKLSDLANLALDAVYEPPRKARPDYAMETFEFLPDPNATEENIAYKVPRLKEWNRNFGQWVGRSVSNLQGVLKKVKQQG
jgi:hypothetical protein